MPTISEYQQRRYGVYRLTPGAKFKWISLDNFPGDQGGALGMYGAHDPDPLVRAINSAAAAAYIKLNYINSCHRDANAAAWRAVQRYCEGDNGRIRYTLGDLDFRYKEAARCLAEGCALAVAEYITHGIEEEAAARYLADLVEEARGQVAAIADLIVKTEFFCDWSKEAKSA